MFAGMLILLLFVPSQSLEKSEFIQTYSTVELSFVVYNSSRGKIADYGMRHPAGETVEIYTEKLIKKFAVHNVDRRRLALRLKNRKGRIGELVAAGLDRITFTAPDLDTSYDIFLMNSTTAVDYDCLDRTTPRLLERFASAFRRDFGQKGPDHILKNIFNQMNKALDPFGIQYGRISYDRRAQRGDIGAGFGVGINTEWTGTHWSDWFVINIDKLGAGNTEELLSVGLEEIFEVFFGVDDICGKDSYVSIQKGGRITAKGIDIITYYALFAEQKWY